MLHSNISIFNVVTKLWACNDAMFILDLPKWQVRQGEILNELLS